MPRSACLTPAELSALHLGDLPETALAEFGGHLETCADCEAAARALDKITDPVLAAFRRSVAAHPNVREDEPPQRIGDYQIVAEIGRGGMGVVYRARHLKLQRQVALKMLLEGEFAERGQRQRFVREAEAVARLQHPHIVQIFEIGEHQADSGLTRPYFTLEFVEGGSLAARLDGRPATPHQAGAWLEPLARAIHYAHQQGIVHRDLKPSNVLLTGDGQPKLCDFGIAKLLSDADAKTQSGTILGTPEYMAPEQAGGQSVVGPAADIHALGALLYTMLTGRPPFQGAAGWETLLHVQTQEPVSLRRLQPTVPRDLETICLKCLQKEPKRRYASAEGLADDLQRFLDGRPIQAHPVGTLERGWRWCRRHPRETVLGALVAAALLAAAGLWSWRTRETAVRIERATRSVEAALDEAMVLHGQARTAPDDDPVPWIQALSVARRAEELLAPGEVEDALAERVQRLREELTQGEQTARQRAAENERDRGMVARLEQIRLQKAVFEQDSSELATADQLYAAAFQDYGIDVLEQELEALARCIRTHRIQLQLIAALDDWIFTLSRQSREPLPRLRRLAEVVRVADPDPLRAQMRAALMKGDLKALREIARRADVIQAPGATLQLLGEMLIAMGNARAAAEFLRLAQVSHAGDVWINHTLALSLRKVNPPRWDEAVRFHEAARALRPDNSGFCHSLAYALYEKGALDEAIATYREVLRLKPDYAEAFNNLGLALQRQGDLNAASDAYRKAIQLKPDLIQPYNNLGNALRDKGLIDAAVAAYQEAIRRRSDFASPYYGLGLLADRAGRFDEAIDYYRKAIQRQQDFAEAHGNLGALLRKKGQLDEALTECRLAVQLAPMMAEGHFNLANVLIVRGDIDGAIAAHREAARLKPEYAEAHCNLGLLLQRKGLLSEGLASLRRGHELGSKRKDWLYPSANWVRRAEELVKQAQPKP